MYYIIIVLLSSLFMLLGCNETKSITDQKTVPHENLRKSTEKIIPIGKLISTDKTKNYLDTQFNLIKHTDIEECGGFFKESQDAKESVYQSKNLLLHISGDKFLVSKAVGIPKDISFEYEGILIGDNFNLENIDSNIFEVEVSYFESNDNYIEIENTEYRKNYDSEYIVRKKDRDDLLFIYMINKKPVAFELVSQC